MPQPDEQELVAAISGLERQRACLGDVVVGPAIEALRRQLAQLKATTSKELSTDERKIVTILFADVSGFTALAEKLDPENVRELTNACFDWLVPVVQKYGGTVDKFIGDEIMALYGAPVAHEDDPERALRTALEMMEVIKAFNQAHGTDLALHLGINTGLVIAGRIGAGDRGDYSVMGDAVNLAARLAAASSAGEIFVGPATHRQTHALFDFKAIAPLQLKGKEVPVQIYSLVGLRTAPESTRGIKGLRAPVVGRDKELGQIREGIASLEQGKGGAFGIVGDAGLGKSRLVAETHNHLPAGVRWAEGRALSYTAGMSYWLAREIILSLLGVSVETDQTQIAAALRRSLDLYSRSEFYPYLARMLELPMEAAAQEQVKFLSAEVLQSRILEALHHYVYGRAKEVPLVLVWEDLHWCDPSSWQVLENLLPLSIEVPLLLLCVSRLDNNRLPEIFERSQCPSRLMQLTPLTRKESGSLMQQLVQLEHFPGRMQEIILDRADGNPFFVEELLRSLIDSGILRLQSGYAIATREIDALEIPETLQGVLAARIDCLQLDDKQALQRASVIGRVFQPRILARLYEKNGAILDASLRELQRREFILAGAEQAPERGSLEEDEYMFKHAITHDVAYGSMLLSHRRHLHELAAKAIESLFPDRLEELSATLGYHYERAGIAERAASYLGRAAERARATFANAEAIGFYESALRQITSKDDAASVQMVARLSEGLGDVLTLVGRQEEAREAFNRALASLTDTASVWRCRLRRKIGLTHNLQRHYEAMRSALDAAEAELGQSGDTSFSDWWEEKVQIQLERMFLFYWQGMAAEMGDLAAKYRSAIETKGTAAQRARFFQMLALSLLTGSRYRPSEECLRLAELAVIESEASLNLPEAPHIRFVLGFVHLWRHNFIEAIEQIKVAFQGAKRVGDLVIQARCLTYLAVAERGSGNVEGAATSAQLALERAAKLRMVEYIAMAKATLSWANWRRGNETDAEKLAQEALELWHGMPDPYSFDWMALWPLIAIELGRKNLVRAFECAGALLDERQHPLPDKLLAATRQALEDWQHDDPVAGSNLEATVQLATELHYL